jgi:predicted CXXCH cytochrome family protein
VPDFKKKKIIRLAGFVLCAALLLPAAGCDQATRHKALTTLFDGVPDLPPAEQLCEDYVATHEVAQAQGRDGERSDGAKSGPAGSTHEPYGEKNCAGCHKTGASNELLVPATELCMTCHVDFIQGPHVHGPIAVGDCLACHLPHQSGNSSLLVRDRAEICSKCHKESRLAPALHQKVDVRGLTCVDCHGAHFGKNKYFLN